MAGESKELVIRVDNRQMVAGAIKEAVIMALEACGQECSDRAAALCPVDTGRLQGSIDWQMVGDNAVAVGTNVEYGKYVELGSSRRPHATPFLKPALENNKGTYEKIFKNFFGG